MKHRLFIAIDFPEKTKKEIVGLVDELKRQYPQIRWEKRENIHLTLKFLGWVETKPKTKNRAAGKASGDARQRLKTHIKNHKTEEIAEGIKGATANIKPFWFQPEKIGYFLSQSLIVWLGVKSQEGFFQIVQNLEDEMAKLGFPKERREFSPHITIGRAKRVTPRKKWQRIAEEIKNFPIPSFSKFKVSEIVLMKSQLTPKGSIYTVMDKVSLK